MPCIFRQSKIHLNSLKLRKTYLHEALCMKQNFRMPEGQVKNKTCFSSGFLKNRMRRGFLFYIFYWKNSFKYLYYTIYFVISACQKNNWKRGRGLFIFLFWVVDPSRNHKNSTEMLLIHLQGCKMSFIVWNIFENTLQMKDYKIKKKLNHLKKREREGTRNMLFLLLSLN